MVDGSAKSELLEPFVLGLAPGIKAQTLPDKLRLVGDVRRDTASAIECSHPALHHATVDISVNA